VHKTPLQARDLVLDPINENRKLNDGTWTYGRTEPLPNCVQSAVLNQGSIPRDNRTYRLLLRLKEATARERRLNRRCNLLKAPSRIEALYICP